MDDNIATRGTPYLSPAMMVFNDLQEFMDIERRVTAEIKGVFYSYIYGMAAYLYQGKKGHLPGSLKTKRLRKKRNKKVIEWYFHEKGDRHG